MASQRPPTLSGKIKRLPPATERAIVNINDNNGRRVMLKHKETYRADDHSLFSCWRPFKETTTNRLFQPSGRASEKNRKYPPVFLPPRRSKSTGSGKSRVIEFSKINQDTLRTRRPSFGNADIIKETAPPGFHGTRWDTTEHQRGKFRPDRCRARYCCSIFPSDRSPFDSHA